MKHKLLIIVGLVLLVLAGANIAYADVGVGVSPSKLALEVEGGTTQEVTFLIYNTGDDQAEYSVEIEGDIAPFTQVEQTTVVVEPEPKPHTLPVKNGKPIIVKFSPPTTPNEKKYEGEISVIGAPVGQGQLSGKISVVAQVELTVIPTTANTSIFAFVTTSPLVLIVTVAALLLIIVAILLLKKHYWTSF